MYPPVGILRPKNTASKIFTNGAEAYGAAQCQARFIPGDIPKFYILEF
jgi:hypothetical protein